MSLSARRFGQLPSWGSSPEGRRSATALWGKNHPCGAPDPPQPIHDLRLQDSASCGQLRENIVLKFLAVIKIISSYLYFVVKTQQNNLNMRTVHNGGHSVDKKRLN